LPDPDGPHKTTSAVAGYVMVMETKVKEEGAAARSLEGLVGETLAARRSLTSLVLSDPRPADDNTAAADALLAGARKIVVRSLTLRGKLAFQFEYHAGTKVSHQNLPPEEARARVLALLGPVFRQGNFYTPNADYQALARAPGRPPTIKTRPPSRAPVAAELDAAASHNQAKNHLLPEGEPVPFLVRLGVMAADGKVLAAKYDKFRQINRFLEMVNDVAGELPPVTGDRPLRVVDFGAGKAYLTFALYHFLHVVQQRPVAITGLDLKADVVAFCSTVAHDLGYDGLTFSVGDIAGYQGADAADLVVSLHACDTATDDALAKAVLWNANVILSVPCCQHELFRQIESDTMRPLLKHGIFKERLSALVTDAARASLLETAGYAVQALEFVDGEHTPKNLLLRAVKRAEGGAAAKSVEAARTEYETFRDFWHVSPHLERLLNTPTQPASEVP